MWSVSADTGLKFCRVDALHLLADLYLPTMKNSVFVVPESNGLSCACIAIFLEFCLCASRQDFVVLPSHFCYRGYGKN